MILTLYIIVFIALRFAIDQLDFMERRKIFLSLSMKTVLVQFAGVFAVAVCWQIKNKKYFRDNKLNDFVCSSADTVFEQVGLTALSCTTVCSGYSGCLSAFSMPVSGSCTGCKMTYWNNGGLASKPGSQHYTTKDPALTTPAPTTTTTTQSNIVTQWASYVVAYSSQYGASGGGWSANKVLGPPNVYPIYSDNSEAWTSINYDANQFIQVQFPEAVYVTGVDIYETYNCGGVKAIRALHNTEWIVLWSTSNVQVLTGTARIFSPPLVYISMPTKEIRIDLDLTAANFFVEIDAIRLVGTRLP